MEGTWSLSRDFRALASNPTSNDRYHLGQDVPRTSEAPVYAAAHGTVKHSALRTDFGYVVVIEHRLSDNSYVCSVYGHLRQEGLASVDTRVAKGTIIGYLSSDPAHHGTGIHLHFGIRNGPYTTALDPDGQWRFRGYGPADITTQWYRPSDFIEANRSEPPKIASAKIQRSWSSHNPEKNLFLLTHTNPRQDGEVLKVDVKISNTKNTWIFVEQDLNPRPGGIVPVNLPSSIHLIGPFGNKELGTIQFHAGSHLHFTAFSATGLPETLRDDKGRAVLGALAVDLMMRGFFNTELPPNAFDQPSVIPFALVDPLLDGLVSELAGPMGDFAKAVALRDSVGARAALVQFALSTRRIRETVVELLRRRLAPEQVEAYLHWISENLGDLVNIPLKVELLGQTLDSTLTAPPSSWVRLDMAAILRIQSVNPRSLVAMPIQETQRISIIGSGFTSASTLEFSHSAQTGITSDPARLHFINSGRIDYDIGVGNSENTWQVRVIDEPARSAPYTFYVSGGADTTPPAAPIGLRAVSSDWNRTSQVQVDWTNPSDPSGMAKAWIKVGSPPVSASDGVAYPLPAHKPLLANVPVTAGTRTIHVWLEDGAGNRNSANRASLTLGVDSVPPVIRILAPDSDLLTTTQDSVVLSGEYSEDLSGVRSITWGLANGSSGVASLSPQNGTWSSAPISLQPGLNVIAVTATDGAGNVASSFLTLHRTTEANSSSVTVNLGPSEAISAGARWRVNKGEWRESGFTERNVPIGPRLVEFLGIVGAWRVPAAFAVNVTAGQNVVAESAYVHLPQLEPPGAPSNPFPDYGAVGVGRDQPRFSWTGGPPGGDLEYAFCIDLANPANPAPPVYQGFGSIVGNSFKFSSALEPSTTYNWRVKARANGIVVDSPVWRFTTEYSYADLAVHDLLLEGNVERGATVTLSVTVKNKGNFISPGSYIHFYLSRSPGAKEIRLTPNVPDLVPGLERDEQRTVTFLATLKELLAGQSFLDAWIDSGPPGPFNERNFANNLQTLELNYIDGKNPEVTSLSLGSGHHFLKTGHSYSVGYSAKDDIEIRSIDIYYSLNDGQSWEAIKEGYVPPTPPTHGASYSWTIPSSFPLSENLKIRMVARDGSGNMGERIAGPYETRSGAAPTVTVLSPNGGEVWNMGSQQQIKWSISSGTTIEGIQIQLLDENTTHFVDAFSFLANSYLWTLPSPRSTKAARIRLIVQDENGNRAEDTSDGFFTIRDHSVKPPDPWNNPLAISSTGLSPRIAVDALGTAHVIYQSSLESGTQRLLYHKWIDIGWSSAQTVYATDIFGIAQARIAVSRSGKSHIVWSMGSRSGDMFATNTKDIYYSYSDGTAWSAPVNLSEDLTSGTTINSLSWFSLPNAPISDVGAAAVVNAKLYLLSGSVQTFEYDPLSSHWNSKMNRSSGFGVGGAAEIGGLIYAVGDWAVPIQIYHPANDSWSVGANNPSVRQGIAVAAANGKLFVIGGATTARVDMYDPAGNTWQPRAEMPTARGYAAAAVVDDKIYVIGGSGSDGAPMEIVEVYDPSSNTWSTRQPPAGANWPRKSRASAVAVNGKIYLMGGRGDGNTYPLTVEEYDPVENNFRAMSSMQSAHGIGRAAVIGNEIFIVGGFDGTAYHKAFEKASISGTAVGTSSSSPTIAVDSAGIAHVVWEDGSFVKPTPTGFSNGGARSLYYRQKAPESNWSGVERITSDKGPSSPRLAIDANNHLHLTYLGAPTEQLEIRYMERDGGGWSAPSTVSTEPAVPSLAVKPSGGVHLVWRGYNSLRSQDEVWHIQRTAGLWSDPEVIHTTTSVTGLNIIADSLGRPHVVFLDRRFPDSVMYRFKLENQWTLPVKLNLDSQIPASGTEPDAAIAPETDALHVVWSASQIFHNFATASYAEDIFPPSASLIAPAMGQVLSVGASFQITWNARDNLAVTGVDLYYHPEVGNPIAITTNEPNDGTHIWTVVGPGRIRLDARDAAGNIGTAFSPAFAAADLTPPSIASLSPAPGSLLTGGETVSIQWTAADNVGVTGVDLEYSLDNGASWKGLASGSANTGSLPWIVPNSATSVALLRATARDAVGLASSMTNGPLTITRANEPPVAPHSPFPLADAVNVPVLSPKLQWSAGDLDGDSLTYEVRFGTSTNPPLVASGAEPSFVPANLALKTKYYWQVAVSDGQATTQGPLWSFATEDPPAQPPSITLQPISQTLSVGATATFRVEVNSTAPISYQWRKNGTDLPNQNGSTLTLNIVQTSDAAAYSVVVTAGGISVVSNDATLTVNLPQTPIISDLYAISYGGNSFVAGGSSDKVTTSTDGLDWTTRSIGLAATPVLESLVYADNLFVGVGYHAGSRIITSTDGINWSPRFDSTVIGNLLDVTFGGNLFLACGYGGWVVTSPDGVNWTSRDTGFREDLYGVAYGNGLFVAVSESGFALTSPDSITWTVRNLPGGNTALIDIVYADNLFVAVGWAGKIVTSRDGINWDLQITPAGEFLSDVTYGSGFFVAVGDNGRYVTSPDGSNWTSRSTGKAERLRAVAFGRSSFVAVGNSGTILQLGNSFPSLITNHPQSQTVTSGGTASFQVSTASGESATYQWRFNGSNLSGETGAAITLSNITADKAGRYSVMVRSGTASQISREAELLVNLPVIPPSISSQPQNQSVLSGADVTLTVLAAGTAPLTYQWKKSGMDLVGQTNNTLVINNALAADQGVYFVVVSNAAGSVRSTAVVLTVGPRPGELDTTFDPEVLWRGGVVSAAALQPDGKLLITGLFNRINGVDRNRMARLNADGNLDTSFQPGAGVSGFDSSVEAVLVQSDRKILIGGWFQTVSGKTRNSLARLNEDGTLDDSFASGIDINGTIHAIAPQNDGKVLVGGWLFSSVNGVSRNRIARLNGDGTVDSTFDRSVGLDQTVHAIAVQADGKILIGGEFRTVNDAPCHGILRLNSNGSLDTSFRLDVWTRGGIRDLALQSDGKIVAGQPYFSSAGSGIVRLLADGSLDTLFDSGSGANGSVDAIAIQSDGRVLIVGDFTIFNGVNRERIARLNSDGSLDMSFNPGSGANSQVRAVVVQPDGKTVIGGGFNRVNGVEHFGLARLNSNGSLNLAFQPKVLQSGGVIASVVPQGDGKVFIGGQFNYVGNVRRNSVARLNSSGSLDTSFDPGSGPDGVVNAMAFQGDGKLVISGLFFQVNGVSRKGIARLNGNGSLDAGFNPGSGVDGEMRSLVVQQDGNILIGGYFTNVQGVARNGIARFKHDGSLDHGFNPSLPNSRGSVATIALSPDGKIYVAGALEVDDYNTIRGNQIARLNADGSVDTSFNPPTKINAQLWSMELQRDGGVLISYVRPDSVPDLFVRLNQDGSRDITFDHGVRGNVWRIATLSNGQMLLHGGSVEGVLNYSGIIRLNSNGSFDPGFGPTFISGGSVNSIVEQGDGKLLIGGTFMTINGVPIQGIARLWNGTSPPSRPEIVLQPESRTEPEGPPVTLTVRSTGNPPPSYQWRFNEADIADATNRVLTLSTVTTNQSGAYSVVASNILGSVASTPATLTVIPTISLGEALDSPQLVWTTGGDAAWFGARNGAYDGVDAAQSGTTVVPQQSWLETTVLGPGTLSFWWKISASDCCKAIRFYAGGHEKIVLGYSGDQQWEQRTYAVPAGVQTFRWVFDNYSGLASGIHDRALLDQVRFVAGAEITVTTLPPGLPISVDGTNYISPKRFTWDLGSEHAIRITSSIESLDHLARYAFSAWSDGNSELTRTITSSPTSTDYEARFIPTEFRLTMDRTKGGGVLPSSGWYSVGTEVTVEAIPEAGFQFWGWSGMGIGSSSVADLKTTVVMRAPVGQSAVFLSNQPPPPGEPHLAPALQLTDKELRNDAGEKKAQILFRVRSGIPLTAVEKAIIGGIMLTKANIYNFIEEERLLIFEALAGETASAPSIAAQPQSKNVSTGANVTMSVAVNGTLPLSFQWRRDGADLVGATNTTLILSNVGTNQAGNYTVLVRNAVGSATSAPATLIVLAASEAPLRIAAGTAAGSQNSQLVLPLKVANFTNIVAFQFSVHWDTNVLSFKGVEQFALTSLSDANFGTNDAALGALLVSWDDTGGTGKTIGDGSTVFGIRFELAGNKGTSASITIDGTPATIEAAAAIGGQIHVLPVEVLSGQISILDTIDVGGTVHYYAGNRPVPSVTIGLGGTQTNTLATAGEGIFIFRVNGGGNYLLTASKTLEDPASQGVTTLDITLIRRQILGIAPLDSPYKLLAADVNQSSSVTTLDITLVRRLILGISTNYPNGSLWRFLPSDFAFSDAQAPWNAPATRTYSSLAADALNQDFIGIKLGDVNGSWTAPASASAQGAEEGAGRPRRVQSSFPSDHVTAGSNLKSN